MGLFLSDCNVLMFKFLIRFYFIYTSALFLGKSQYSTRPKVSITVQYSKLSVELHYWHNSKVLLKIFLLLLLEQSSQFRVQISWVYMQLVSPNLFIRFKGRMMRRQNLGSREYFLKCITGEDKKIKAMGILKIFAKGKD